MARAQADPLCSGAWPAAPRAFAAYTVTGGALCWSAEMLAPNADYDLVSIVGGSAFTARAAYNPGTTTTLVTRDAATGAVRWQATMAGVGSFARPMRDDAGIVVLPADVTSAVVARDVATGAERWRAAPVAPTGEPRTLSAIVDGGATVYIVTLLDRGNYAARLYETVALDRVTGATRWRLPVRGVQAGPDGLLAVLADLDTGQPLRFGMIDPANGVVRRELTTELWSPFGFGPDEDGVQLVGGTVVGSTYARKARA